MAKATPITDSGRLDEEYVKLLEHRVREKDKELQKIREEHGVAPRERRGRGGTPNLTNDVLEQLKRGPPSDGEIDRVTSGQKTLHELFTNGPAAISSHQSRVYGVHERAHMVLRNADSLSYKRSDDRTTVFLTAPTVKRFLEASEDTRLKHTQVRRVFEQLEQAGSEYPRPTVLHKNTDDILELVIFDFDQIVSG